jgi:hypothetical protein
MRQKKAVRPVHIVARYFIKKNHGKYHTGSVVLHIRNDKGVEYTTIIRPNGVHSCDCPAKRTCYHETACAERENAREAAAEQVLTASTLAREVEAIVVEAEKELAREVVVPAREIAPLNYRNQGFSLLRR